MVQIAAACSSSSWSAVAARTQVQAASYLFFVLAATMTMASSFFRNSVTSIAWRSSLWPSEVVAWHTKWQRGSSEMQWKEREKQKRKNMGFDYHIGERRAAEYCIV
jgi:hypothetical protein